MPRLCSDRSRSYPGRHRGRQAWIGTWRNSPLRQSKHNDLVNLMPIRHWTDSKIRCHILACIIALCCLRLIELRLERAGLKMTAVTTMEHMHRLHSCLVWHGRKREPARMIEEPSEIQAQILKAFGHKVDNVSPVASRLIFYFISTRCCRFLKIAAKLLSEALAKVIQ